MCGIAGYINFTENLKENKEEHIRQVESMGRTLKHRGQNSFGSYVGENVAFSHARLAVIDPEGGLQPMVKKKNGFEYAIVYNGEIYNAEELKQGLLREGYEFTTASDTEVVLTAYMAYGAKAADLLNGIYSFAVWDSCQRSVFLCRDRFGVKPFFYSIKNNVMVFGSEIKALFQYPQLEPVINQYSLCELFGLGPARSPGCGVYEGIHEIPPGYCGTRDDAGLRLWPYYTLKAKEHKESYEDTVLKVRELLFDAIQRQLVSDVPICTLMSGGLDSSLISAVASACLKKQGKQLATYSFDYTGNEKNFKASSFQPDQDRPYVDLMVKHIGSSHHYLECEYEELFYCLYDAVLAKDLPGMADVDSSMLYFAREIKKNHTVCLSGECADEVFGGYPWFRAKDSYEKNVFPWSPNLDFRKEVMNEELVRRLPLDDYVRCQYQKTMDRVPVLDGEDPIKKRQREISYLNTSWFMTTLLDRKDRMTMYSGLEVRVPFADHRLIEYLYNIPWEFKYHGEEVKGLLKDVGAEVLPKEVLYRKKCPYPKTYDPKYEAVLKEQLRAILKNPNEPVACLIDKKRVSQMMDSPSDYGKPWFGQLMALPQMYAYLIEINFWLSHYKVKIKI